MAAFSFGVLMRCAVCTFMGGEVKSFSVKGFSTVPSMIAFCLCSLVRKDLLVVASICY